MGEEPEGPMMSNALRLPIGFIGFGRREDQFEDRGRRKLLREEQRQLDCDTERKRQECEATGVSYEDLDYGPPW